MKDYIKKENNLNKYVVAEKSKAETKGDISKARSEMLKVVYHQKIKGESPKQ